MTNKLPVTNSDEHGVYTNFETLSDKFKWTDYNCEGCHQYKMLRKRESDGKLLCKKCSKNKCLRMFK